jgi:hypothetical protein
MFLPHSTEWGGRNAGLEDACREGGFEWAVILDSNTFITKRQLERHGRCSDGGVGDQQNT